jgi:hypothetical protein
VCVTAFVLLTVVDGGCWWLTVVDGRD